MPKTLNMKRMLVYALFVVGFISSTYAQGEEQKQRIIVSGGPLVETNVTGFIHSGFSDGNSRMKAGIAIGGFVNLSFSQHFSVQGEMVFMHKHSDFNEESKGGCYRYWGVEIPVYAMYHYPLRNGGRIYVGVGPYTNFGLDATFKDGNGKLDLIMQPSDFSLSGSATIKGIYTITAKGNNNFRGNKSRLSYSLQFMHKTLDFWGISYDACAVNPISEYTKQQIKWQSDYVYKFTPKFHVGAAFSINYASLSKASGHSYLEGQKDSYFFTGVGLSLQYDMRDFILNPKHGIYLMLREVVYPCFMSSYNKTLANTILQFDIYQPVWQGATLAFDLPSFDEFELKNTLPNYGLGLRIEFKHNVNVRVDYGFGKDMAGIVFQFAEAF